MKGLHEAQQRPRWMGGSARLALAAVFSLLLGLGLGSRLVAAPQASPPAVTEPIVATVYAGPIRLHGDHLGDSSSSRSIRFDYGARSQTVAADSPLVQTWQPDSISLTLPPEVQSGRLTLTVDGASSNAVDLLVFDYQAIADPPTSGTNKHALALAVAPDGTAWLNQEFHLELKAFSADTAPAYQAFSIPEASGPGIFAATMFGDSATRASILGEDIAVASDGTVWFTQGGELFYPADGAHYNTSRIIGYDPEYGAFHCFNAPFDNASVIGVLVDQARGMVWYSEAGWEHGAAISGFALNSILSNCDFDPYRGDPRDPICATGPGPSCHWRFPLPNAVSLPAHLALDSQGDIWFTEFMGNRIGRLTPETGQIVELPLPAPIAQSGPGALVGSSGPWELAFDQSGDLWVSEFFDATIAHVHPALLTSANCLALDANGANPCVEEALVASSGTNGKVIHTISAGADAMLWFGVEADSDRQYPPAVDTTTIGFVSPAHGGATGFLPHIDGLNSSAGIVQDPVSHDIWIAQSFEHMVGWLRQLGVGDADGDGVPDSGDNCVIAANPAQDDWDANGIGDMCDEPDIDSDGLPNPYELTTAGCDPRQFTDDRDGLATSSELQSGQTNPCIWDSGAWGCAHAEVREAGCDVDTDGDGCRDAWELGPDPALGGQRDPQYPWDYFNPTRDGQNRVDDVAFVISRYGRTPGMPDYTIFADRSSQLGPNPWDLGPPDGRIQAFDVLAIIRSYHHDCAQASSP